MLRRFVHRRRGGWNCGPSDIRSGYCGRAVHGIASSRDARRTESRTAEVGRAESLRPSSSSPRSGHSCSATGKRPVVDACFRPQAAGHTSQIERLVPGVGTPSNARCMRQPTAAVSGYLNRRSARCADY